MKRLSSESHRGWYVQKSISAFVSVGILVFALSAPAITAAQVVQPDQLAYGKSYSEWSAVWWQWAFSLPIDNHPLFDTADCSEGQTGPVWFLGGTFTTTVDPSGTVVGEAERNCTVPAGKSLFFPIINTECSTLEGNGTTDAELRSCAAFFQDHAHDVTCQIDGARVKKIGNFRVQSPLFEYGPLPENNVLQFFGLDAPAGSTSASVADGIYVMVAPLSKGRHTIHFTGSQTFSTANGDPFDFDFRLDITYHITVR